MAQHDPRQNRPRPIAQADVHNAAEGARADAESGLKALLAR